MDRYSLAVLFATLALLIAAGAWALDQRNPCLPEAGCMDERGPVHPTFGLVAAFAAWATAVGGWALRTRLHGAWMAGLAFWPVIILWWPAASVLEYAPRGPVAPEAWAFPALALLDTAAFVALAAARRAES